MLLRKTHKAQRALFNLLVRSPHVHYESQYTYFKPQVTDHDLGVLRRPFSTQHEASKQLNTMAKHEEQSEELAQPIPKLEWTLNKAITDYANQLLTLPVIELESGVKKIELSGRLQRNEHKKETLIIRPDAEALWNDVYNHCMQFAESKFVVTGNPGIGKSRSMTYLLRKLLIAKKLVIYDLRKDEITLKFVPTNGKYRVYSIFSAAFTVPFPELDDPSTFYLIDPDVPQKIRSAAGHTILAASPNKQHYHEFAKNGDVLVLCMPPWKYEEICAMHKDMKLQGKTLLTDEELLHRYKKFGGRPRFIFDAAPFYDFALDNACNNLDSQTITKVLNYSSNSLDVDQSNANSRLSSMLFEYHVTPKLGMYNLRYLLGPETTTTTFASEYVRSQVLIRYWDVIMDHFSPNSLHYVSNSLAFGNLFEEIMKCALVVGGQFECRSLEVTNSESFMVELPSGQRQYQQVVTDPWKDYINECINLPSKPLTRIVLMPNATNNPTIDAMDARHRAYQITIANKLSINVSRISSLLHGTEKLQFYFVVPSNRFTTFEKTPLGANSAYIDQYVLSVPIPIDQQRKSKIIAYFSSTLKTPTQ